jgi:ABC-type transport system involved in Fe-S cluster assembly fused permease/ATPase subunit
MRFSQQVRFLWPYFWVSGRPDLRARLIAALVCLVLAKVCNLVTPWLLGQTVDSLDQFSEVSVWMLGAVGLVCAYVISRLGALVFSEIREVLFTHVSQRAIRALSKRTFEHLHRLPIDFHLSRHTGSLDRLIDRGTKAVDFLLRYVAFNIGPTLIELVVVSVIVWSMFGGLYALLIAIIMCVYIILTLKVTTWRLRFRRHMNDADNSVAGRMVDSFINVETVRLFANEDYEANRIDEGLAAYESAANQSRFSLMLLNLSQTFVVLAGVSSVLIIAVFDVKAGTLTVGGFVALNTYMLQAFQPLNFLGSVYRGIRQSFIDMENLFDVLDEQIESDPTPTLGSGAVTCAEVVFDRVRFAYQSDRLILSDVSFCVEEGQTVAIVGETGSGKTTIGRLLLRMYEPTEGVISLGGIDLKNWNRTHVREMIGVVPQDAVLFNESLRHNIGYGRVTASDEEIFEACETAGLGPFLLGLPDGLDTQVGARGLKLSGGEKQRVAIARAVLKQPSVLLFDEATSSLDTATEANIQANLEAISQSRTTIIVAHRLSTVIHADRILVLDKGVIVESGTHDILIKKGGLYARLWQARDDESVDASDMKNLDRSAAGES